MNKFLIATTIPAKLEEYKKLLKDYKFDFLYLKDLKIAPAEELGVTMEDAALSKAKYYYEQSHIPTLVDAGGMEIDALNAEPGLKSHRWLGYEMSDEEIINRILERLQGVPKDKRTCRYSVALAIATKFGIFTAHGTLEGVIAEKPSKKRVPGHPYSSVMFLPHYGKYLSELSAADRLITNHRMAALTKLSDILIELSK